MDTQSSEIISPLTTATWRLWRPPESRTETALASALWVPKAILDALEDRPVIVRVQTLVVASPLAHHTLVETRLATATTPAVVRKSAASPVSRPSICLMNYRNTALMTRRQHSCAPWLRWPTSLWRMPATILPAADFAEGDVMMRT